MTRKKATMWIALGLAWFVGVYLLTVAVIKSWETGKRAPPPNLWNVRP